MSPRILMISTHGYVAAQPELGKPDTGGQVVYVLELSKALARQGYEVDILTRQFGNRPAREQVTKGVQIHRVPCGGPEFIPKEILSNTLPELVRNVRHHAVLAEREYAFLCSHYWDAGIVGDALSRTWQVPHVHVPHSIGLLKRENHAWGAQGPASADNLDERIRQERIIYHRCDLVISTAAEQTRCLAESDEYNAKLDKIVQIPPGYDESVFFPMPEARRTILRQKLGWPAKTILAAGRLAPNKGYDLLLQALPIIRQRVPEVRLVLAVGSDNPGESEARQLNELRDLAAQLEVSALVSILSCVPQIQLADYYRAADAFVLCSRHEPFGMTAIEALACGTPTIVTTQGGLWEELSSGRDCLCCDPRDRQSLAQAVSLPLLHAGLRESLSRQGIQTVRARYRWTEIVRQIVDAVDANTARPVVAARALVRASRAC